MNTNIINQNLTTSSMINQRIESVDDPQLNKILFSLYERLISPFRDVEDLQTEIKIKKETIEKNNDEFKIFFSRTWDLIKFLSILFVVLNIIVFVLACFVFKGTAFYNIVDAYYCLIKEVFDRRMTELLYFFFIPLFFAVILSFLTNILKNIILKKANSKLQDEIVALECLVNEKVDTLTEVACFVPVDYRNSYALEFFVNAFANSKVDNLKEAVNLSDTHMYRNSMLQSQQQIINKLESLEFIQLSMLGQLDDLRESIWLSSVVF